MTTTRLILRQAGLIAATVVAVAVLITILAALLGPAAYRLTPTDAGRANAVNATRQLLLASAAGVIALVGLAFTARSFYLSRRAQFTDRYTKAIAQLASDKSAERLGGIYALEHVMRESARDHQAVVDVLAAFVREQAPRSPHAGTPDRQTGEARTATDVQAALTVLGRRPLRQEVHPIDLSYTSLRRARLSGRFAATNFSGADLTSISGIMGDFSEAVFCETDLGRAVLYDANLDSALFDRAVLDRAELRLPDGSGPARGVTLSQLGFAASQVDVVLPYEISERPSPGDLVMDRRRNMFLDRSRVTKTKRLDST